MRSWLVLCILLLSGCSNPAAPDGPGEAATPAEPDVDPGLPANATLLPETVTIFDVELPVNVIDSNLMVPFEGHMAMIVDIDQEFQLNGAFDGPFLLIPESDIEACRGVNGDFRGLDGATTDNGVNRHAAGRYIAMGLGGSGTVYFSGFPSNQERVVTWLSVPEIATIQSATQTRTAEGLDASIELDVSIPAAGRALTITAHGIVDTVLEPNYYASAGQWSATLSNGCEDSSNSGGPEQVIAGAGTAPLMAFNDGLNATFAYERQFDERHHALYGHVITFTSL